MRLVQYSLFFALVLALSPCCRAAWVSEVWLTPQTLTHGGSTATIPRLIEVSGLAPQHDAEIFIIDALDSPSRYGRIRQRFVLPAGSEVRVLGEQASAALPPGNQVVAPAALDLTGSRAILVFDRLTGLEPLIVNISALVGVAPSDVLTIGPPTLTRSHPDFPQRLPLDVSGVTAVARPNQLDVNLPMDEVFFTGTVSSSRYLAGEHGQYLLNPGWMNLGWAQEGSVPEPASLLPLVVSAAGLLRRRR